MWKVLLAFVSHRLLLFIVAILVINASMPSTRSTTLPEIHSRTAIAKQFAERVSSGPEAQALRELVQIPAGKVFRATANPFLWVARWGIAITGLPVSLTLILLSNLFFGLFLWQLYALFNRMVPPDVATFAAILVVLWPTSYELSLGSTLSLSCLLATLSLRLAVDGQWLGSGLALAVLGISEPLAIGMLPLLLYLFFYFQRHFPLSDIIKRAVFFLVPFGAVLFFRYPAYAAIRLHDSALFSLLGSSRSSGLSWTLSQSLGGQTLCFVFFAIGAVSALFSNTTAVHRAIPAVMLILLMASSPYGAVASRAPLAGVCMEGIASASSRPAGRVIQLILLALGIYEIYAVFQ